MEKNYNDQLPLIPRLNCQSVFVIDHKHQWEVHLFYNISQSYLLHFAIVLHYGKLSNDN